MLLKELKLINVKCFKKLVIDFVDEGGQVAMTTVVLGKNGTGKSNLLKAIALITSGSSSLGELLPNPNEWIRTGHKEATISAILNFEEKSDFEFSLSIHYNDNLTDLISRNQEALKALDARLSSKKNAYTFGYGVVRRMGTPIFSGKLSQRSQFGNWRSGNVESLFVHEATLYPLDSWAMDLDYREGDKGLKLVKSVLNKLLPEIRLKGIDRKEKKLIFNTMDGEMDLYQLSEGYQITAAWVGDLLYRISSFNSHGNPTKARGLLLIDELGLHLHPSWQRHMLDFIKKNFPNLQLISTTHSPFIAQQCEQGELRILRRKDKNITIETYSGSPDKLLIHQVVMSDIFGLETDESVKVETMKNEYESLKGKEEGSEKQQYLKESLENIPISMKEQKLFNSDYMQVLSDIQKELKKSKSNDSDS